jgi:predicted Rossmann fold nucleotide-binding protein DprA/Smf involved in DNA uptake
MKLAIVGSRSFDDYYLLSRVAAEQFPDATQIISGGAAGADRLAAQYAGDHGLELTEHRPDWKRLGRAAGQIRNRDIIDAADAVLAFWDGSSRGTRGGLEYARKQGKRIVVVYVSSKDEKSNAIRVDSVAARIGAR